jgi:hypothetical protein
MGDRQIFRRVEGDIFPASEPVAILGTGRPG